MAARRIFLHAVIFLALSITVFGINLLFFAKPLYALYADLFQSGQMYQGETRALIYNRFLLIVIAPCSFILGSALTWLFITFKWVAWASTALILILVFWLRLFCIWSPYLHLLHRYRITQMPIGAGGSMAVFSLRLPEPKHLDTL